MLKRILPLVVLAIASTMACAGPRYGRGFAVGYGPPPPPRYGPVGYAPRAGYVWCDGYWDRGARGWNWAPGSWQRPPRARAAWVPGRWAPVGRDYRFHRGYWR